MHAALRLSRATTAIRYVGFQVLHVPKAVLAVAMAESQSVAHVLYMPSITDFRKHGTRDDSGSYLLKLPSLDGCRARYVVEDARSM